MDKLNIQSNIPLAPMTTFKIGGPAKFFIEVKTIEELKGALNWALENNENYIILGGGSNVLVNDDGFDGVVIKPVNKSIKISDNKIACEAGAQLSELVALAVSNNLSGLEWAVGIPGTIGGAVRGNAGAFGEAINDSIKSITTFNLDKKDVIIFDKKDCQFEYRESFFKKNPNFLIWQANIELKKGTSAEIKKNIEEYLKHRTGTQPKLPSAGSIFKNIKIEDLKTMNKELAMTAEREGKIKGGMIAAGWLIETLGLKGKTIGGAKISLEHANFIINTGSAKASDVLMLISYIKQQVRDSLKVQLKEEIQYLGF